MRPLRHCLHRKRESNVDSNSIVSWRRNEQLWSYRLTGRESQLELLRFRAGSPILLIHVDSGSPDITRNCFHKGEQKFYWPESSGSCTFLLPLVMSLSAFTSELACFWFHKECKRTIETSIEWLRRQRTTKDIPVSLESCPFGEKLFCVFPKNLLDFTAES